MARERDRHHSRTPGAVDSGQRLHRVETRRNLQSDRAAHDEPAGTVTARRSAWLTAARIQQGPVFRRVDRAGHPSRCRGLNRDSIGKLLKRAAARARMNTGSLGGHSLRAGCVTQAAMNGVREFVIQRQTGHRTVPMLRRYIRSGEIVSGERGGRPRHLGAHVTARENSLPGP